MSTIKKPASSARKFCTVPEYSPLKVPKYRSSVLSRNVDCPKLIKYIDDNVVGKNISFLGPFGRRKIICCDYVANGRGLHFIEDYILKEVLPLYGSTHTSTNITALQSTLFSHEARDIVRNAVHASEEDAVIFTGHGSTEAVRKLIQSLKIDSHPYVVFVGASEHYSAFLPWREIGAKVIRIAETKEGFLDLVDLERKLTEFRLSDNNNTRLVGCFPAASSITGILADDLATTILLHQYGALSFWDYTTSAPYVTLDVNPLLPGNDKSAYKDAIFFSGHKFIGGVQSPGVLVAKKYLFQNDALREFENDTAEFCVSRNEQRYVQDIEIREGCSTATIVESVRLGLALHLKQTVSEVNILSKEEKLTNTVLTFLRGIPEIIVLGNASRKIKRLAVFSFVVKHPRSIFLHHNFICAVLNDLFGIQATGDSACARSYTCDLLGINEHLAEELEHILAHNSRLDQHNSLNKAERSQFEMLRPGFIRISLPYFVSDSDLSFTLEAVKMVAAEGWKLLPQYIFNMETAEWKHRSNTVFRDRKWLGSIKYTDGKMSISERKISGLSPFPQDNVDCLQTAKNILNKARRIAQKHPLPDQTLMFDSKTDRLRWFLLPSEAQDLLLGGGKNAKTTILFDPSHSFVSSYCHNDNDKQSNCKITISPDKECEMLTRASEVLPRHNSLSTLNSHDTTHISRIQKSYSDCGTSLIPVFDVQSSRSTSPNYRLRCHSLESRKTASDALKKLSAFQVNKHCSCSSQTDISDSDSIYTKDGYASGDFNESIDMGIRNLFRSSSDNEQIQAYVKGVTEEIATEIKSEIRGVIAKVDDALSESLESLETGSMHSDKRFSVDSRLATLQACSISSIPRNNSVPAVPRYCHRSSADLYSLSKELNSETDGIKSSRKRISSCNGSINGGGNSPTESTYPDSVSDHVAFYLAELTSEMVTEMKSEFREMVSAVDEIISPAAGTVVASEKTKSAKAISATKNSNSFNKTVNDDSDKDNSATYKLRNGFCKNFNEVSSTNLVLEDIIETQIANNANNTAVAADSTDNTVHQDRCKESRVSDSSNDSGLDIVENKAVTDTEDSDRLNTLKDSGYSSKPAVRARKISLFNDRQMNVENDLVVTDSFDSIEKRKRSFECVSINPKWHCPPKAIWKPMVEAIKDYDMIREGDRLLLCLSGGKDSLSLLHALHQYQYYAQSNGVNFTLGAVTIDSASPVYDPRPLIPYLHALGVHYQYEEQKTTVKCEKTKSLSSINSFFSRNERDCLYKVARTNNYNLLALGQHFDDFAENFMMSLFHKGQLRSMKAHYYIAKRDLRVIRPFVYVREKHLRQFAENRKLPVIAENCSRNSEILKEKHRVKQLLAQQEILNPRLFGNLRSAIQPLISFHYSDKDKKLHEKTRNKADKCVDDSDTSATDEEEPASVE